MEGMTPTSLVALLKHAKRGGQHYNEDSSVASLV